MAKPSHEKMKYIKYVMIVIIILILSSCSLRMKRITAALAQYERDLSLQISSDRNKILNDEPLTLKCQLTNSGKQILNGCLGETNSYEYFWPDGNRCGGIMHLIDHPGCQRMFTLGPGENITWNEKIETIRGSKGGGGVCRGEVSLIYTISIVYPKDGDQYGFYDTHLRSPSVPIVFSELKGQ